MSTKSLNLVKWTFPTLALILGLFWYRRRRADRVDPGGISKLNNNCKSNSIKKVTKRNTSVCDSSYKIDESSHLSKSCPSTVDIISSPRKVSSSLDIPGRKPASQPISIKSLKSIEERIHWYDDDDDGDGDDDDEELPETQRIKLGSNPRSTSFDMMPNNKSNSFRDSKNANDLKLGKAFSNILEEEQVHEINSLERKQVPFDQVNNISNGGVMAACKESNCNLANNDVKTQALSERDSANHSPVSGVLDGSLTDEARSEGSQDSGKGGSIKGHSNNLLITYEFAVPYNLVGKLIGQRGSFLQNIREKTDIKITVNRCPNIKEFKICVMEGTQEGINLALKMIRQKFPEKRYPYFTLEQISIQNNIQEYSWVSELMHLSLVEGVNNDVLVCYIVKPNRFFIHLPTHPTYPSLRILDDNITQLYESTESPPVPDVLSRGMIFVAKLYNRWVRVYVENPDPKGEHHLVRLVDHGGYWTFSSADMRKIRSDFLTLPFQAIEVSLANVRPVNGEWQQEAYDLVAQICCGIVGQAQIEGYIDSQTYISLYLNIQKHGVISLADELIARGFAEPASLEEVIPEVELPLI